MPDGGTLTDFGFPLEQVPATRDLAAGRYIKLCVSDTGCGMDPQTLSRAIEPFFSTKEVGKGTGLGLSMIHGLALQLKGALEAAERRRPRHAGRAVAAGRQWRSGGGGARLPAGGRCQQARASTLLFVDDDFLISLSTAALLEDLGHDVIKASSGAAALDVLKAGKPIDLLITDYAMPGMTGVQLAEAARKLRPDLPILLATGYADLPARAKVELPRLSKPYQQKQLAERITSLVG